MILSEIAITVATFYMKNVSHERLLEMPVIRFVLFLADARNHHNCNPNADHLCDLGC
jgi:hypothetical protein